MDYVIPVQGGTVYSVPAACGVSHFHGYREEISGINRTICLLTTVVVVVVVRARGGRDDNYDDAPDKSLQRGRGRRRKRVTRAVDPGL